MNPLQFWSVNNLLITGILALLLIGVMLWRWGWGKPKHSKQMNIIEASVEHTDAKSPEEKTPEQPTSKPDKLKKEGKYPALVIPSSGQWYFEKIPEPVGHIFICDTTMPETGEHYLVQLKPNGEYEAYDPRTAPIVSTNTPEIAYLKTQDWEADIPYVDDMGIMEKLPAIMAYCLMGLTVLAVLIKLGK